MMLWPSLVQPSRQSATAPEVAAALLADDAAGAAAVDEAAMWVLASRAGAALAPFWPPVPVPVPVPVATTIALEALLEPRGAPGPAADDDDDEAVGAAALPSSVLALSRLR
jgi:hypothetical protein